MCHSVMNILFLWGLGFELKALLARHVLLSHSASPAVNSLVCFIGAVCMHWTWT
jgi:hypothetical protein